MGQSKNLYMETHQEDIQEYFQWLREEEWQQYLNAKEEEFHKKYGHSLAFKIEWYKFKLKNDL